MTTTNAPSAAVTTDGAAPIIGVSPATLKTWRHKRIGPPYVVIGTRVRYRVSDLEAWMAERTVTPEAAVGQPD